MIFVSYAQNFEDVMLWRALKHIENGFYIDVGAHDPEAGSVTKAFYDRGWHGINVEPITEAFQAINSARTRDINIQACMGATAGDIDLYDITPTGLATALPEIAELHRAAGLQVNKIKVPVRRLDDICIEYVTDQIHFLKIDVEGFEADVLKGMTFSKFRPWVLVIEATVPNSPVPNFQEWEEMVLGAGYCFAYFDGLNRFYVAKEHSELMAAFDAPPNFFDGFVLAPSNIFGRLIQAETQQEKIRAQHAEAELARLMNSRSWRITAPLRNMVEKWEATKAYLNTKKATARVALPKIANHIRAVIFDARVRVRAVVKRMLIGMGNKIAAVPWLKHVALYVLDYMPGIKARLLSIKARQHGYIPPQSPALPYIRSARKLSRPAMRVYLDLKRSIPVNSKEQVK